MPKWESWTEERSFNKRKNVDKNKFCKKNKMGGGRFGPHNYSDGKSCILCGHIKKEQKSDNYDN